MRALARAGQHTRVAAEVEALAKLPGNNGYCLWQLAVIYAGWVETVRSDAHLAPAQRQIEAGLHEERAVMLLRKLLAQGYFDDRDHAWSLFTDKGLNPLHDHGAYRQLLAEWNRRSLEQARNKQKRLSRCGSPFPVPLR